jgi:hypothetical protein
LIYAALAGLVRHIPPALLLAALAQLFTAFILLSLYGSLLSVGLPPRVAARSLKRTKASTSRSLLGSVSVLLSVVVAAPVVFPALLAAAFFEVDSPLAARMTLVFSVLELALLAPLYLLALRRLGRFLQRREKDILQTVAQEVE